MVNVIRQVAHLLKPGSGLTGKVVRGGFWVFALRLSNRLLGLVSTIILARVLAPSDFGLFGVALLAMGAIETFSQMGINIALVQKKDEIASYLDTAWTFQALRGALLALILFAIAPSVAFFFDTPAATPILQVIGFSTLIRGLTNIGVVYFQKELEFNKQYFYQLSGTVSNVAVAITAVILLQNIWALVFGLLAGNLAQLIVSYAIHPYRPRPRIVWKQFLDLFHFGKWFLGSSILIYLVTQGDSILVGKLLGVTALGLYQMAYRISNMPATEITHVISEVTFPAYAKIQKDLWRLREAYFKVFHLTLFFSFLIAWIIFILSYDITLLFLGDKWLAMVPTMKILIFSGLLRSIEATANPIFNAVGKPFIVTKGEIIRSVALFITIYPLIYYYGLLGVSLSLLFSNSLTTIYFIKILASLLSLRIYIFIITVSFNTLSIIVPSSLLFLYNFAINFYLKFLIIIIFIILYFYFSLLANNIYKRLNLKTVF